MREKVVVGRLVLELGGELRFHLAQLDGLDLGPFGLPGVTEHGFEHSFGQPPIGSPSPPLSMSMTLSGKPVEPGSRFTTSAGLMPRVKRKSAMSPTTLLDGVTFTMSPKR